MKLFGFGWNAKSPPEPEIASHTATFLCIEPGSFTASAESDQTWALKATIQTEAFVSGVVEAEGGQMLNAFNASFCAMFVSAPAALRAATRVAGGAHIDDDVAPWRLPLLCGLHTGLAYRYGARIFSSSIGTAQWMCSLGRSGQVVISDPTAALVRAHVDPRWVLQKSPMKARGAMREFYFLISAEEYACQQRAVFISYRRGGGSELARLIASELRKRDVDTFIDLDDLSADYFDEQLLQRIETTPNFVLILTPGCLERCQTEGDWFRREIAHALKTDRNIIPVMAGEFRFPATESLPAELANLPRHNGVPYSHEYAMASVDRVISFLTPGLLGQAESR